MTSSSEPSSAASNAEDLTLYYFDSCPFCIRVLRAMELLGIDMNLRNIRQDPGYRQELIQGGGRPTVPCLRIDNPDGQVTWMYESADIVEYLTRRFG